MSRWAVQAEGDAPESLHAELADRLGKLLSLVKYGTEASQFGGEGVNGPVHEKTVSGTASAEGSAGEPAEADSSS